MIIVFTFMAAFYLCQVFFICGTKKSFFLVHLCKNANALENYYIKNIKIVCMYGIKTVRMVYKWQKSGESYSRSSK